MRSSAFFKVGESLAARGEVRLTMAVKVNPLFYFLGRHTSAMRG